MKLKTLSSFFVLAAVAGAFAQEFDQFRDEFFGFGFGNSGRGSVFYGRRSGPIGAQLGIYNNTNFDRNSLSTSVPPGDTQFLGRYRTIPGFGFDLLFFAGSQDQSAVFGIGLYDESKTNVGRSASSGLLYGLGETHILRGGLSVGFRASTGNTSEFGFGYHNLLGWNLSLTTRH
ncbi:MAG TPA: hypothetical protein VK171_10565 [Fimbriimonas sp.]|nr:hypothetical protein [Fimbriimonas sp.]